MQELEYGGLSSKTKVRLKRMAARLEEKGDINLKPINDVKITCDSIIKRKWRGREYEVIKKADRKYLYDNKEYNSLSKIAKIITGSHWSGPLFFGLRE